MVALCPSRTHAPQQKLRDPCCRSIYAKGSLPFSDRFEAMKLVASNVNITQGPPGDHFRVLVCRVPS
jgi:hypothetical protein